MTDRPDWLWEAGERDWLAREVARRTGRSAIDRAETPELHPVRTTWGEVPELVRACGPALLQITGEPQGYVAVLGPADVRGRVRVLDTRDRVVRVPVRALVDRIRAPLERHEGPAVDVVLDAAGLSGASRRKARENLLERRLRDRALGGGLLVRTAPSGSWMAQVRDARVSGPLLTALFLRLLGTVTSVGGWVLIGRGALEGHIDPGWVVGWALLMGTGLLLGELSRYFQGRVALRGGLWTKQHLLHGALRLDPAHLRGVGPGGLLARMAESQALEDLVLSGGMAAVFALVDLAAGVWMLTWAPYPAVLLLLALGSVGLSVFQAFRLYRRQSAWTGRRRRLTSMLVERMLGHRTRLAQARPASWHAGEDEALAAYHQAGARLDTQRVAFTQLGLGVFPVLGIAVIGVAFIWGGTTTAGLAVGIGAVLWMQAALAAVVGQSQSVVSAIIAWGEIGPLVRAASVAPKVGTGETGARPAPGEALLRGLDVGFAHGERGVFEGIDLEISRGDRVLLTGPSGSGKSTLVRLLTGLAEPTRGLLLCRGLDASVLGEDGWRALTVAAPQFNDNHIFEQSVSFNLLFGREWPASQEDRDEALEVCRALGLGEVIARMPGGMAQALGESGWQLSHGERSRLFLARALLQDADLVVLDESFAALDPVTLRRCLAVAEERCDTLVVVAHP